MRRCEFEFESKERDSFRLVCKDLKAGKVFERGIFSHREKINN